MDYISELLDQYRVTGEHSRAYARRWIESSPTIDAEKIVRDVKNLELV